MFTVMNARYSCHFLHKLQWFKISLFQVDLSETVDSGNVSGDDVDDDPEPEFDDSEEDGIAASKDFDEFHVDLCLGCSNSLPLVRKMV